MDERLYQDIHKSFLSKPGRELRQVLAGKDIGEWSEEAIAAAENILASRPQDECEEAETVEPEVTAPARGVFPLSPAQVRRFRLSIQILGWVVCILGIVLGVWCIVSFAIISSLGKLSLRGAVGAGVVTTAACMMALIGAGLIRLDPRARKPGVILAVALVILVWLGAAYEIWFLPLPIGTALGLWMLLLLWKRGHVLTQSSNPEDTRMQGTNVPPTLPPDSGAS